ncbi:MAG: hypothetical protein AAF907_10465, partial [Planctomycetota bacterium]
LPAGAGGAHSLYGALAGQVNAIRQFNRLQLDDPGETIRDFDLAQSQATDAIFGPEETARLHMSDADLRISRTGSRLLELAPVSFAEAPGHEEIRKRFAAASWDVATAAHSFDPPVAGMQSPGAAEREWQYTGLATDDATVVRQFPPRFGTAGSKIAAGAWNDPFRWEVRQILGQAVRNGELNTVAGKRTMRRLIRKLSFNAVAERVTNPADPLFDRTVDIDGDGAADGQGELRLRSLTPHPTPTAPGGPLLDAAEIVGPPGHPAGAAASYKSTTLLPNVPRFGLSDDRVGTTIPNLRAARAGSPNVGLHTWDFNGLVGQPALRAQEWHARRDRQNLARDIYVLLYTVGGVDPVAPNRDYTTDNAGHAIYSEEQLREMAQLAVNIVDAMDSDPVRTLFVFDKNLANGYTAFDDGYANPPAPNNANRGMVVGVERQELAISEVLANIAWAEEKSFDGMGDLDGAGDLADHPLTEWNDAGSGAGELNDFLFIELAYTGPGELNFADNPATSVQGDPGENFRIVVRNPRDTWQFREDANGLMDADLQARAIIPRAGSLSAARPYFTIASANDQYVPGMTFNAADARSRMRVNFKQTLS